MAEQDKQDALQDEAKKQSLLSKLMEAVFAAALVILLIVFIVRAPGAMGTIALVALGFGAVIIIHELGHFIVAKLGGIKVEAFSIGFPPTLLGIRKLKKGLRVRLFPKAETEPPLEEGDSETEYRLGLIPFGGFVKMLGQSDSGPVEKTDDPRSFTNKPTWIRVAVVAAGVTFNALSAILVFSGLYFLGNEQFPAVVGSVVPNSPAEAAGIRAGDRIIAVNGESFKDDFVDFTTVAMSGALTPPGEAVQFTVRRPNGQVEETSAIPKLAAADPMKLRQFGIEQAQTLLVNPRIGKDPNLTARLYEETGLRPGDEIQAVEGQPVKGEPWKMDQIIQKTLKPEVELTVARTWPNADTPIQVKTRLPLNIMPSNPNFRQEIDLADVYTMVPRLKVEMVAPPQTAGGLFKRFFGGPQPAEAKETEFKPGDIIVKLGGVENPTYQELREVTTAHKDKPLTVEVLRKGVSGKLEPVSFTVTPRTAGPRSDRVLMGIVPGFDMEHAVVAATIETPAMSALNIPRGARIALVDGESVESFYDVIRIIRANPGQRIGIDYRIGEAGGAPMALDVPSIDAIHMRSSLAAVVPLLPLREEVKTSNPLEALSMGARRTWYFVETTYVTIQRLLTGNLSERALSGPVGILQMSYAIAKEQSFADFLNFMGLISACLAFMNLLPIPIVDGGVIVLLLVEKLKGGPLPIRVQAAITYVGLALILTVFLWITYNDIMRWLFG
jgi:regulator of sigma E protease